MTIEVERRCLIDKAVSLVGGSTWRSLPDETKRRLLFDVFCPAGGSKEEKYHRDGSRYWEKTKKM